ncbi:ABC transporter ATP-binding protein/permease [Alphaproteobacteria bacterium]|nr:ABC transporter ATP-binding protein/permease [Alphaproteobacteria bacterium]
MALIDMIGVASILPFMAVLTNPNLIESNQILNFMYQYSNIFGVETHQQFLFFLGILVFLFLVISLLFKALTNYAQVRFIQMRAFSIGRRLIEGYLYQPYSWFLTRHSADLEKNILSEVDHVVAFGISSLLELISRSIVTLALMSLIILADPKLTLVVGLLLGFTYILIYFYVRNYLNRTGEERLLNNKLRFTAVSDAFGAAKEVKIGGLEENYIKIFSHSAKIFARSQAAAEVISQLPRYLLEAIAFGGILLIILYMMSQTGSFNNALPILSLYVFVGYRLMPSLQQIYVSFTHLAYIRPSLEKLSDDLKSLKPVQINKDQAIMPLNKEINLKNISFSYPNTYREIIKNISLTIPVNSTIGLVGATASGKTTIVDIILGLLEVQKGSLEVDGQVISKDNLRSWQRSIGYVPQNIYLSDDTVSANIAFGVEPNKIEQDLVEKASKIASAHNFVIDELPDKYLTLIGERGVKLSGGQRQRIGIARALYNDPKILILDEATSSLDNQTEETVMKSIYKLSKKMTIIIIAHRLGTVKNCDKIFFLSKGKLELEGNFDELKKLNKFFQDTRITKI